MKNIFIEGIQGAGKSTLFQQMVNRFPQLHACREGDYSPVELAWCTWMTKVQYEEMLERYSRIADEIRNHTIKEHEHYIVTYTRILTDIPGFHKDLENYEIYNGRKTMQELEDIVLSRYQKFRDAGYLFECAFFQNIMEDLILFQQLSDDEIVAFYKRLYEVVDQENFLMIYLHSEDIGENINIIKKERSDHQGNPMWYPLMLGFLTHSPYGVQHGCQDFEDLVAHFEHRQKLELRIIEEVLGGHALVLPAKEWSMESIESYVERP